MKTRILEVVVALSIFIVPYYIVNIMDTIVKLLGVG